MSDHGVKTGPTMASPFYPQKRTLSGCLGMSEKCHEATRTEAFAPAFRAGRFPGFPKKSPPCRQWIGNENPRRDLGATVARRYDGACRG